MATKPKRSNQRPAWSWAAVKFLGKQIFLASVAATQEHLPYNPFNNYHSLRTAKQNLEAEENYLSTLTYAYGSNKIQSLCASFTSPFQAQYLFWTIKPIQNFFILHHAKPCYCCLTSADLWQLSTAPTPSACLGSAAPTLRCWVRRRWTPVVPDGATASQAHDHAKRHVWGLARVWWTCILQGSWM